MDTTAFSEKELFLEDLFSRLDPALMGGKFSEALQTGDTAALIRITADHFRTRPKRPYCDLIDCSNCTMETADRAVKGDVTVIDIPHKFPGGKIDWFFNPTFETKPVNHEWLWQLSRMTFWKDLCFAYQKTGDEKYAKAFNDQLFSWISTAKSHGTEWNVPNSVWRTIETGLRMMYSWPLSFETFRHTESFTDENICLMLSSMYRHGVHLQKNHKNRTNWLLMEMSGLYTFAVLFPEFKTSTAMRAYAVQEFSKAVSVQILPDGVYDELSPDYHGVLLGCAFAFCQIAETEKFASELPEQFMKELEKSFESVLEMATPGLTSPRTNDCFTCSAAKKMERAFMLYPERKDFLWGASKRQEGTPPADKPSCSRFFPWGGFAVMRSDWGPESAFCCFDVGPLGMAHMHQDKLNINIYKGDQELIYDDGGGQYEHSVYRAYGLSAAGHNTVLVDGMCQLRTAPRKAEHPISCSWISDEKMDYACGTYDDDFAPFHFSETEPPPAPVRPAKHTREVRFFKPEFFCVKDTLVSLDGKSHTFEMRLHLDTVKMEKTASLPGAYLSDFGETYDILIVPLFPETVETKCLSGVDTFPMAGWFVGRNDKVLHKSTTLTMTVPTSKEALFATLLIPVRRSEPLPQLEQIRSNVFTLRLKGKEYLIDLDHLDRP